MSVFETAALIPGSYDPPHKGHIAMIERVVSSGIAEKFVVAAIKNPTKKRLLDPENSVALLEMLMPDYLRGCVVVENGSGSTLSTADRHGADVVIRGGINSRKDALHELVVKYFFNLASLSGSRSKLTLQRSNPLPDDIVTSSTEVRRLLSDNHHNNYFRLQELVTKPVADVLIEARDATPYPLSWPEGRRMFNSQLSGLLSLNK